MALAEYGMRAHRRLVIREQDERLRWLGRVPKFPAPERMLDDEIYELRSRMEQLVRQGQALTSAVVVEASRRLDEKINEIMHTKRWAR